MAVNFLAQHDLHDGFTKAGFAKLAERIDCTTTDYANTWHMLHAGIGIGAGLSILAERGNQIAPVLQETTLPKFSVWLVTYIELKTQRI